MKRVIIESPYAGDVERNRDEWRMPFGSRCLYVDAQHVRQARVVGWIPSGEIVQWHSLLRWVWPLTGWWSDYRWIVRRV